MRSIRSKFTFLTACVIMVALSVATAIGVISIRKIGRSDADQMIHLTATTGAMNLESYFESVEHSVETVATLVQDSLEEMPFDELELQVESSRNLFSRIANNTNGVLTYYFRIDPKVSETIKGFWFVNLDGKGFEEHEVTDITQYDTDDTSVLVWFTVPKATGEGMWLPPYYTENLDVRVISYNVPVYRKDQFIGVIGIEIDYETLKKEAEEITIFDSGYAFILDADSNVIYHPDIDSTKLDLETTAISHVDKFIGSNHIQYNYEGTDKEAVWIPLRNGMRLYVCAPVSEIDSGWHAMIWNTLIASIIILVVAIIITMRFVDRITKPLIDLTQAAKKVDEGNYDFDVKYDEDDEVGILTNTIKQLVDHTREHISKLNKQVYVDALTSVRNKGGYGQYIHDLQEKMDDPKQQLEFAIGVFDCNDLKHINDTYGHDKGDIYLKAASKLICRIYQHSPVFRIGGDEFAVILENDDLRNRDELLKQFIREAEELNKATENDWEKVDLAIGFAVYDPELDTSIIDVARRADSLMYENKHTRKEKHQ